jgi:hypothetical protein
MASDKITVEFEIQPEALALVDEIVAAYDLPDRSKAIRCLLDYAAEDGDRDAIFGTVRCRRCGED